jgi:Na+-driven multidrug efflux pump
LHVLSTPEDIFANAYSYLLIIFLGIPFTLLYNLEAAMLRAVGDSRTPFVFLAISTLSNILLDLLCILVLHWGVAGAAIATITAQAFSGILCFFFILKKQEILHIGPDDRHFDRRCCLSALGMGAPMGLQFSITAIGSMVMQAANNGLGSVYVSGFTAGARLKQFTLCPFDALATAVCNFCGQNLGAKRFDRIREGIRIGLIVATAYGAAVGLVLVFGGRVLSMLFISSSQAAVLDASAKYLRYLGCMYWMLGILHVCRQSIQGLGYSSLAVLAGAIEMVARIFVSVLFVPRYGFTAICCADQAAWLTADLYLVPMCFYLLRKVERLTLAKTSVQKGENQ